MRMYNVFNSHQMKPYNAKNTLLDALDPPDASHADEEEVHQDLGSAKPDDGFNPPIFATELAQIFRAHFRKRCELREKMNMLTNDYDALPGANAHLNSKDDVMLAPLVGSRGWWRFFFGANPLPT